MEKTIFRELVERYIAGTVSDAERVQLMTMIDQPACREELEFIMREAMITGEYAMPLNPAYTERFIRAIEIKRKAAAVSAPVKRFRYLKASWLRYAAAVVLIAGTVTYLYNQKDNHPETATLKPVPTEKPVVPGKQGAILTLADGSTIVLDSLGDGTIASQNGAKLVLEDGRLAYNRTVPATGQISWNTMKTPRGRQFQITLPDGTKVWLNAASFLRYPTVFTGTERKIEISGEAYFEVAKNATMPFRAVINGGPVVEVLGTHFNISAYTDEPVSNTTLLEGSVNVSKGNDAVTLQPGQAAIVADHISVNKHADTDKAVAWKNGLFNLEGASVQSFMRQVARWYEVEVIYKSTVPEGTFHGELGRDLQLSQILDVLREYNISYRLEGRKLIIQ